jgi:hypothetical protein
MGARSDYLEDMSRCLSVVCCSVGLTLLMGSSTAAAQSAMPRHVEDLVSEVLLVVDQVTKDPKRTTDDGEADGEPPPPSRTLDGGVLTFTRTMVNLLWKGVPVHRDREVEDTDAPERPILIHFKPRGVGGQLRCTFRF